MPSSRSLPIKSPPRLQASASTPSPIPATSTASSSSLHRKSNSTSSLAGTGNGNAIRRLSDDDVRAIFECLHHRHPLPSRLQFTIVPVGPNGLKLSPPSYEFEDGLYVLLRPPKKPKAGQTVEMPLAPDHLEHLVARHPWPESCPWSLSGPQFPQPTAIQQRYCYPKGDPVYSARVGGALWTMYGANGKEDLEFRLLHVYFSAKRAVNKGLALHPPPPPHTPSPHRRGRGWDAAVSQQHPQQHQRHHHHRNRTPTRQRSLHHGSPPHHHYGPSGICHSPLSFDWSSPSSLTPSMSRGGGPDPANWVVTPVSDLFRRRSTGPNHGSGRRKHSHGSGHTHENTPSTGGSSFSTPSPIRKRGRTSYDESITSSLASASASDHAPPTIASSKSLDALDIDSSLHDIESYWNDPLMTILMQPSNEAPGTPLAASSSVSSTTTIMNAAAAASGAKHHDAVLPTSDLSQRLTRLHDKLREMVAEDDTEAATVVREWAEGLANEFKGKVQV